MEPCLIFPYLTPILVESLFSMPEISSSKLDTKQYPSLEMVEVEGGSFRLDNRIECKLSSFFLGRYLVTQALWEKVMTGSPSRFKGPGLPVEGVSWYDCVEFCNQLSERQGLEPAYLIDKNIKDPHNKSEYDKIKWHVSWNSKANGFRLPTETEWEYAARGGTHAKQAEYAGSSVLKEVGWYHENSHRFTRELATKIPNELGFYDISGNVWEWCWDWRDAYPSAPLKDPQGPQTGSSRVLRGGSWFRVADFCRVADRNGYLPDLRNTDCGLRLARTVL